MVNARAPEINHAHTLEGGQTGQAWRSELWYWFDLARRTGTDNGEGPCLNGDEKMTLQVARQTPTDNPSVLTRNCPLCGADHLDAALLPYGSSEWPMVQCRTCAFVYLSHAPRYEELSTNRAWEKTFKIETERRLTDRPVSKRLSKLTRWRMKLLPRNNMPDLLLRMKALAGIVIDVGCGDGGQMNGLDAAYIPGGIEISAELAHRANENFSRRNGWCIHAPSVAGLSQLDAASISAVTLRSYLEHELDPLPVLRQIRRVLKPDGIALVKVPNYGSWSRIATGRKWCGIRLPDHLNYFTPGSLREMSAKAGFKTHYGLTWRLPTSDNMWAALRPT